MATFATALTYMAAALVGVRVLWHVYIWSRAGRPPDGARVTPERGGLAQALWDVVFLRRLFVANPLIWVFEWMFHVSVALVFVRHLRYVLYPAPEVVIFMQPVGVVAGYVLPFCILGIAAMRICFMRERFASVHNAYLLGLIALVGISGLALGYGPGTDITAVVRLMRGAFALSPEGDGVRGLFYVHHALALLALVSLPTHVMTAPVTMLDASRRERGREGIMR